jgi:predicted RNA-binding Zn-ribbon protein involved in translation (DUF1610 family)
MVRLSQGIRSALALFVFGIRTRSNAMPAKKDAVDELVKAAIDCISKGGTIRIVHRCRKCGGEEPYKSNPSPNWMNRFTCPKCGRSESR